MAKRPVTVLIGGRKYSRNPQGEIVDDTGAKQTGLYADIIAKELDSKIEEQAKPYADVSAGDKKTLDDAIKKVQQTSQTYKVTFKETGESFKTSEKMLPKVLQRAQGRGGMFDSVSQKQFDDFATKFYGYIDKDIAREKRRLESMERRDEIKREVADELKKGEPEKEKKDSLFSKFKSNLGKAFAANAPLIMAGIFIAMKAFEDEINTAYDNIKNTINESLDSFKDIMGGIALAGGALALGGGAAGIMKLLTPGGKPSPKPVGGPPSSETEKPGTSKKAKYKIKDGKYYSIDKGTELKGAALESAQAAAKEAGKNVSKDVIKKSILKRMKGLIGKSIPVVGFLFAGYDAVERAVKGDVTGSAIAAGSAAASFVPGVGTALNITGSVANIVRDVYKELYGNYPEQDAANDAMTRMKEIYDMALDELKVPKKEDKGVKVLLEEYTGLLQDKASQMERQPVGNKLRAALKTAGASDEEIKNILYSAMEAAGINVEREEEPKGPGIIGTVKGWFGVKSKDKPVARSAAQTLASAEEFEKARAAGNVPGAAEVQGAPTPAAPVPSSQFAGTESDYLESSMAYQSQNIANVPIVLPPKMLEGPPIVIPNTNPSTGPSDIHTQNDDPTLNRANQNTGFSTNFSYGIGA